MTDAIDPTQSSGVNQADYLKLFMQELTYQDPLKPIDNREFMSQMAQFSALQAAQSTSESVDQLVSMTSANQSLMLLGKQVKIQGNNEPLTVQSVQFFQNKAPNINVSMKGGTVAIELKNITEVEQ